MIIPPDHAIVPMTAIPAHTLQVLTNAIPCVVVRRRLGLQLSQLFPRLLLTPTKDDIPH
jgi:hypothetical protein